MQQAIIILLAILLMSGVIGHYELREIQEAKRHALELDRKSRFLDQAIQDAAHLERDLAGVTSELYRRSYRMDVTTDEFLGILADHLAADDRCRVVIEKISWQGWADHYNQAPPQGESQADHLTPASRGEHGPEGRVGHCQNLGGPWCP